jgi:hypothetical protein
VKRPDPPPDRTQVPDGKAERERRLAEALRTNLRKRKEQQRARDADPAPGGGAPDKDRR